MASFAFVLVILASFSIIGAISPCPSHWFSSAFMLLGEDKGLTNIIINDPDLTYLKDVIKLTEEETTKFEEDALDFFNKTYGLDFSQVSQHQGVRTISNAIMIPFRLSEDARGTRKWTFNRWIATGSIQNQCFDFNEGGYLVIITSNTILYGTYGGPNGKAVAAQGVMEYGYFYLLVCPQQPSVMPFYTPTPRHTNVDGYSVADFAVYNRELGNGIARGLFYSFENATDTTQNANSVRIVFTFT